MTAKAILEELKPLGRDTCRKGLLNHGLQESCFGARIHDLKKIQKRIKKDYRLALDLCDTGIYDAMYLAGLIADDAKMTKQELQSWANRASGPLAGSTVPWVAAGSPHGPELALEWIESKRELLASAGWATLNGLVSTQEDADIDLSELKGLLQRVERTIHQAPNAVRCDMNGFVIAARCYLQPMMNTAKRIGERIGRITVNMGYTACQAPFAPDYIRQVEKRGAIGK